MVHVEQYHRAGWAPFLNQWVEDAINSYGDIDHYNQLATESPAYQVEEQFFNACAGTDHIITLVTPSQQALRQKAATLKKFNEWRMKRNAEWMKRRPKKVKEIDTLVYRLQKEGELTVVDDRVVFLSDKAKEELSELIPSAKFYEIKRPKLMLQMRSRKLPPEPKRPQPLTTPPAKKGK